MGIHFHHPTWTGDGRSDFRPIGRRHGIGRRRCIRSHCCCRGRCRTSIRIQVVFASPLLAIVLRGNGCVEPSRQVLLHERVDAGEVKVGAVGVGHLFRRFIERNIWVAIQGPLQCRQEFQPKNPSVGITAHFAADHLEQIDLVLAFGVFGFLVVGCRLCLFGSGLSRTPSRFG